MTHNMLGVAVPAQDIKSFIAEQWTHREKCTRSCGFSARFFEGPQDVGAYLFPGDSSYGLGGEAPLSAQQPHRAEVIGHMKEVPFKEDHTGRQRGLEGLADPGQRWLLQLSIRQ